MSFLFPCVFRYSSDLLLPAAFGVTKSRGQNTCERVPAADMRWPCVGFNHGATSTLFSCISSTHFRVSVKERSFHRPCPNINTYGLFGFLDGRRARKRDISSVGIGHLLICSTTLGIRQGAQFPESQLTTNIYRTCRAGKGSWIVLDDICALINPLNAARLDVKLIIAEAFLSATLLVSTLRSLFSGTNSWLAFPGD